MKIYQVSENIYRGPRPENGWDLCQLCDVNVSKIFSLEDGFSRWFGWRDEAIVWQLDLFGDFYHYPMSNFSFPRKDILLMMAREICLASEQPGRVYVHCYAGVDRTGIVIAAYRVKYSGWTVEKAWDEAVAMGMHKRYQIFWKKKFFEAMK